MSQPTHRLIANLLDQLDKLKATNKKLKQKDETDAPISPHVISNEASFATLNCKEAFQGLTDKEALYAYHICQASWEGAKIVLLQTAYEAPIIFTLLLRVCGSQPIADLKTKSGVSDEDFRSFLIYAAAFFENMGNYKSFGDQKICPGLSRSAFKQIVDASAASSESSLEEGDVGALWEACSGLLYDIEKCGELGFPPDAYTAYYSNNCTKEDAELAQSFLNGWVEDAGYNTRLFKETVDGKKLLTVRLASAETGVEVEKHELEDGVDLQVVKGDYSPVMRRVAASLLEASKAAANPEQESMLKEYAASFTTGSIDQHKEGSRYWIRDKGPIVESYIGFIESYRDPFGVRGEWEGFVAVVNKKVSEKFNVLVDGAETMLPLLPWPTEFEKDRFLRPDFTSLDVIGFGSSGIPAGINIPNYDDIRQDEGFKNVSLGNVLSARDNKTKTTFLRDADDVLYRRLLGPAFEVQVGLHELLGHGSGKLFREAQDGTLNFDKDAVVHPETGGAVTCWYKPGETWDSQFPVFGSSYEECRAECVGLYLCCNRTVLNIFGHTNEAECEEVAYINWLNMARAGLLALEYYRPEQQTWGQAHMQARFAIMRVMLGALVVRATLAQTSVESDPGLLQLKTEGNAVFVELDRSKIETVGMKLVGDFLRQLQVYKATADYATGKALYDKVTSVPDELLALRSIVLANKKPRQMFVQPHLELDAQGKVQLREFEASAEGMITAMLARFGSKADSEMLKFWSTDKSHMQHGL